MFDAMPHPPYRITGPISLLRREDDDRISERRELVRLSVRWPLTIKTESGHAHGETRNITGRECFFIAQTGYTKESSIL